MDIEAAGRRNPFLTGSLTVQFLRTAAPMVAVMMVSGLLNIVDAIFLGRFVGAEALSAVTLVFPLFMILIALSSLVGSGAASLIARALGAGAIDRANRVFGSAQRLSVCIGLFLTLIFVLGGQTVVRFLADDDTALAAMAQSYILPIYLAAPMNFILSLQYDTLRSEGRVAMMSAVSAGVTLLNVLFNAILIIGLGLGVLGSALGTIAAQAVALVVVVGLRAAGRTDIRALPRAPFPDWANWRDMVALGLPGALNFIGVSLMSVVVIFSVHFYAAETSTTTIAAYGVIQRMMTFAFFPILGLSLATQAIVGNNFGASLFERSNRGLVIALSLSAVFALFVQALFITMAGPLGRLFISEPTVIAEVERILPVMVLLFVIFASAVILAGYHQAIGDAARAAIFGTSQVYLFSIPVTLLLPRVIGEWGIWVAMPVAHGLMGLLITVTLLWTARRRGRAWGLFIPAAHSGM